MQNLFYILILLLPISIYGQDDHFEKKNALKISPFEFGRAEFQISYERYFGDRSSSFLFVPSVILKDNGDEGIFGWQLMSQYRFYLTHIGKNDEHVFLGLYNLAFYTGVYALYRNSQEDYLFSFWDDIKMESIDMIFRKEIDAGEAGTILGIQVDITSRIQLDFYVGGGIRITSVNDSIDPNFMGYYREEYGVFDQEYQGVKPRLGFNLGITF